MAEVATSLAALAQRWADARAGERANLQLYLVELCDALHVGRPRPRGSGYEFELQIDAISLEGAESANFIDCWKAGHFALEGKDDQRQRQGKASNEALLQRAYGQVRNYVHHVPGETPPPYLMVLDVAKTLIVWDRWSGTYGGFDAGRRIDLATLHERPDDIALLRDVWENPAARDRRGRAQVVTTDLATKLARLAAALEARGHAQEVVARFLMRVVFSCFAEDIGLLPPDAFRQTVTEAGLKGSPAEFTEAVEGLWRLMDGGGRVGPLKFLRFNGHFFQDATALPLARDELALLEEAAKADWSEVEPSIFGTLLTRALDPVERHRLGAEYTPRAFIERLVRPTLEDPVRERWTAVQADVVQLTAGAKPKPDEAEKRLREFHAWLRGLTVLDPACGSGNFLYVAMHALKRVELEVLRAIERVTGHPDLRLEEIGPWQFAGIEVKPWAREIAELTLWIGYHQWWKQHHDVLPSEPILRDTGTLDRRDAVLAWTAVREDATRSEPDPTPRLRHPVTDRLVPDPEARRPYHRHVGAGPAAWPAADFIVGNPPYIGGTEMRETLGSGYVDALRGAYPSVPDGADYVMYWWTRAADAVASGRTVRAGLITTNSITQVRNRALVEAAAERGVRVTWAVADHPWVEERDGAAVRVAMTVLAKEPAGAALVTVDDAARVVGEVRTRRLNADLSAHADVPTAAKIALRANAGLSFAGFQLFGDGFILSAAEAERLIAADPRYRAVVKPYRGGKDLTGRARGLWVIDFGLMSEEDARDFPLAFDLVRDRVRPERIANRRPSLAKTWWRFGYPRGELRRALAGLARYVATTETAKHRFFTFLSADVAPDNMLTVVATADAFHLGVLSSRFHVAWALAAGGRLGVGNDPRYQKTLCFDPFPFPSAPPELRQEIAALAERLDAHRWAALGRHAEVTMTRIYNVVAKLRTGEPLTAQERVVHELAACGVLRDLHDALDARVAAAYGWSWPEPDAVLLERLVALHDQRVVSEHYGEVEWLRPTYQRSLGAAAAGGAEAGRGPDLGLATTAADEDTRMPWPKDAVGQITALRQIAAAAPVGVEDAARRFVGAPRALVQRHLETLDLLGELVRDGAGLYAVPAAVLSTV